MILQYSICQNHRVESRKWVSHKGEDGASLSSQVQVLNPSISHAFLGESSLVCLPWHCTVNQLDSVAPPCMTISFHFFQPYILCIKVCLRALLCGGLNVLEVTLRDLPFVFPWFTSIHNSSELTLQENSKDEKLVPVVPVHGLCISPKKTSGFSMGLYPLFLTQYKPSSLSLEIDQIVNPCEERLVHVLDALLFWRNLLKGPLGGTHSLKPLGLQLIILRRPMVPGMGPWKGACKP